MADISKSCLIRITSNFFCAGFDFDGKWDLNKVAPILIRFLRQNDWSIKKFKQYCINKGWQWEEVTLIYQIHYSDKKYPNMPYQNRHCKALLFAKGRPFNVLVKLNDGTKVVVPFGNLFDKDTYR